jgi:hypothetical protein
MNKTIMMKAAAEYQCPGCMNGNNPDDCIKVNITECGCTGHHAGTMGLGMGTFALGLPRGFNRFGPSGERKIEVYESYDSMMAIHPNLSTMFSVPVWKHLDAHGNTVMRWFSPRINNGWSCVVLGDCRDKFPQAQEITAEHLDQMD